MSRDDNYKLLIAAIIEQAVNDYRAALRSGRPERTQPLERFFLSEWGQLLTRGYGEDIIERVKREIKNAPY